MSIEEAQKLTSGERVRDASSSRRFSLELSNTARRRQRVFCERTATAGFGEQRNKLYGTYGPRTYSQHAHRIYICMYTNPGQHTTDKKEETPLSTDLTAARQIANTFLQAVANVHAKHDARVQPRLRFVSRSAVDQRNDAGVRTSLVARWDQQK